MSSSIFFFCIFKLFFLAESSDAIAAMDLSFPFAKSLADPAVSTEIIDLKFFSFMIFWHWLIACAWLLTYLISSIDASGFPSRLCSTGRKYSPWICNLYSGNKYGISATIPDKAVSIGLTTLQFG